MLKLRQLERALIFQKAMGQGLDGKPLSPDIPRDHRPKVSRKNSVNSVPAMRAKKK